MGNRYLWSQYDLESEYWYDYDAVSNKMVRVAVNSSSSNPSKSNLTILAMADKPDPVGRNQWTYNGSYYVGTNIYDLDPTDYPYCMVLYEKASSSLIRSLFGTSSMPSGSKTGTLTINFNTIGGNSNNALVWGGDYIYWSIYAAAKSW